MGSDCSDCVMQVLGGDHRRLDAVLADAKRALVGGEIDLARTRFAEFRAGLECHIEAEEQVLFPAFESLMGTAGAGPTHVMQLEHAELRKLMAEVAANIGCAGERCTTPLAALTARIRAHNGKEERILYPAMDRVLGDSDTLKELKRRLQES